MADARRMGKSELFSHFAERFEVKRTQAREFFDELAQLAEKELKKSGEFVLPGMVKLVVQKLVEVKLRHLQKSLLEYIKDHHKKVHIKREKILHLVTIH